MALVRKLYKEFVYGGHFQSLGAASLVLITFLLFAQKVSWLAVILAYLLFYPLYLFNRLWEIEQDVISNPERSKYFKLYLHRLPLIFALESVLTAVLLILFAPNINVIIFGGFLYTLGLLYTTNVKKLTKIFLAFKNFYVAAFFASLVFFSELFIGAPFNSAVWWLALFIFLKGVLMQILLDIKDYKTDKEEGLKTFVVVFGQEKTLLISLGLGFILAIVFPWYFSIYKAYFPVWFLFSFFSFPFYSLVINLIKNNQYKGYILVSGEFLFWSIILFLGKIIL